MNKLFAVYLGGRAEHCNTELHDVVFVIGERIEATYEQLMEKWFGTPVGLHLDSWIELSVVDGHKITVNDATDDLDGDLDDLDDAHSLAATVAPDSAAGAKLFFINLGAYMAGQFGELHANIFVVANTAQAAKTRAKVLLHKTLPGPVHTDDLYDVDDCVQLNAVGAHRILLEKTTSKPAQRPVNGYHLIPTANVRDFMARRTADESARA
jgi:Domain of Unknown Function (DUF1543)